VDQRREGSRWTRRSFAANAVRFQPSCAAIQPRQLHANHGDARGSGAVVPDEFAEKLIRSGATADVRRDPDARRLAAGAAPTRVRGSRIECKQR
jgi:hypothetical protein